jgi:tol-pal system-associated acyl-CoA thioesterase
VTVEFSTQIRVYIEDTDAGGIVYYVNYLKYLERARTEFMRSLGIERAALSDQGWMFVVSNLSLQYRHPARLDDCLEATVRTAGVGGATIDFIQTVRLDHTTLVEGQVQIACVDRHSGRPRRLNMSIRNPLTSLLREGEIV